MSSSSAVPQPTKRDIQLSPRNELAETYRRRATTTRWFTLGTFAYVAFAFVLYLKVGRVISGDDGRIFAATVFSPPVVAGAAYVWANVRRVRRALGKRVPVGTLLSVEAIADRAVAPSDTGTPSSTQTAEYRAKFFADEIMRRT